MVKVKINGKNYNVKEMAFAEYTKMEEQGFSIIDAFRKRQMTLIAMGFVCAVVGCDRDEAEHLITQHVLGGGNIIDITNAFADAVAESDFFQKMLGMTQDEQETPEKATKLKKEVEEVAEEE
nr:MAG TPA: tail assembly chaperone protein [Bacteriophage sp.]